MCMNHSLTVKVESERTCCSLQQKTEHYVVEVQSTEHWSVKQLQPGDASGQRTGQ